MIHPSYQELIQAINEGQESEDEPLVTSRYSHCPGHQQAGKTAHRGSAAHGEVQGKKGSVHRGGRAL